MQVGKKGEVCIFRVNIKIILLCGPFTELSCFPLLLGLTVAMQSLLAHSSLGLSQVRPTSLLFHYAEALVMKKRWAPLLLGLA